MVQTRTMVYKFTFEQATKIASHYQYLVGADMDNLPIHHVVIAPYDETMYSLFINNFQYSEDNKTALAHSGSDSNAMRVVLVHLDKFGGNVMTSDIDAYLTRTMGKKIY